MDILKFHNTVINRRHFYWHELLVDIVDIKILYVNDRYRNIVVKKSKQEVNICICSVNGILQE